MTPGQISVLYRRIASVTTKYGVARPVEQADADFLADALRAAVPEQWVQVTALADRLVVLVGEHAGRIRYRREILASK